MIDFDVRVQAPMLDLYRRQWTPAPDVALAGMWIGAVVADASGETYFGLRGADDFLVGMTHVVSPITGFKKLPPTFDPDPPHLFAEYSSIDWFEPMEYAESPEQAQLSYYSGRIERDTNGLHWYDAAGRWEMHGSNVSDVVTVHVPTQDGIDDEAYYRHELLAATARSRASRCRAIYTRIMLMGQSARSIRSCRSCVGCKVCGCHGYTPTTTANGAVVASGRDATGWHSARVTTSRVG